MGINVNKLGKNPFKEVRNDYCEFETGLIFIDCWVDDDDNSEGISVATIDLDGTVTYKYPQEHFESSAVLEAIAEAIEIQKEQKQKLIDECLEEIKNDVLSGDVTAIDELLKFIPAKNLRAYLPEK